MSINNFQFIIKNNSIIWYTNMKIQLLSSKMTFKAEID
jgi:hypothetical protein